MKLSEAIREGCKQTLPGTVYALRYEEDGKHACAVGCALLAVGVSEEILLAAAGSDDAPLRPLAAEKFGGGILADKVEIEYYGETVKFTVFDAVIGLNDSERMTREQIADWLEGLDY